MQENKYLLRRTLCAICPIVCLGILFVLSGLAESLPLQVKGKFIRDEYGRVIFLHGVNISQKRKRSPYRGWYGKAEYEDIGKAGFNVVRLLMSWAALEPVPLRYNQAYIHELKERVEWIASGGAYVLLDMHQDLFGEGFGGNGAPLWACDRSLYEAHQPRTPWWLNYFSRPVMLCFDRLWTKDQLQDHLVRLWRKIAETFVSYPNVIGYDLFNEPHWGSYSPKAFERDRLQPFYEKMISAIREVDRTRLIFIEPIVLTQFGTPTSLMPFEDKNLVFAPHYYHPLVHEGKGYDGRKSLIRSAFFKLSIMAKKLGMPWWLGEFGGPTLPEYERYFQHIASFQDKFQIGGAYWVYERDSDDWFGILNKDGEFKQAMLDILLRPQPRAISGRPISYRYDFSTRRFKLTFIPDHTIKQPTIVFLDERRHYPEGFTVSITGGSWQYNQALRQLLILSDPRAKKISITVRPAKKEIIDDVEIQIKKRIRFHIKRAAFAGSYISVLFEPGYDPPCMTKSTFTDGRPYCVFAYKHYQKPGAYRKVVMDYLSRKNTDLSKISQVHIKIFYQALADRLSSGEKEVKVKPIFIELWSEANFFPEGKVSSVGYPARNVELSDVWVEASAGFPYYDTEDLRRAQRAIGSLDTGVFFTLTSQLAHQFLLLKIEQH